jgi:hypothetical protein
LIENLGTRAVAEVTGLAIRRSQRADTIAAGSDGTREVPAGYPVIVRTPERVDMGRVGPRQDCGRDCLDGRTSPSSRGGTEDPKFFPKLAVACHLHLQEQQWARQFHRPGPRAHPRLIYRRRPWAHTARTTVGVGARPARAVSRGRHLETLVSLISIDEGAKVDISWTKKDGTKHTQPALTKPGTHTKCFGPVRSVTAHGQEGDAVITRVTCKCS